jgi:hypothetical protein
VLPVAKRLFGASTYNPRRGIGGEHQTRSILIAAMSMVIGAKP